MVANNVHGNLARVPLRRDRLGDRMEHIEKRLDLVTD